MKIKHCKLKAKHKRLYRTWSTLVDQLLNVIPQWLTCSDSRLFPARELQLIVLWCQLLSSSSVPHGWDLLKREQNKPRVYPLLCHLWQSGCLIFHISHNFRALFPPKDILPLRITPDWQQVTLIASYHHCFWLLGQTLWSSIKVMCTTATNKQSVEAQRHQQVNLMMPAHVARTKTHPLGDSEAARHNPKG